jgi:predicted DNA-binding transcriptional regulator YafY
MHVPTEEELAAIAVAYRMLQGEAAPRPAPVSRWRLAARALPDDELRRTSWHTANRKQ